MRSLRGIRIEGYQYLIDNIQSTNEGGVVSIGKHWFSFQVRDESRGELLVMHR